MRIRREIYTAMPPSGDYILTLTGYSWNVGRSHGDGTVDLIGAGERENAVALATMIPLADAAQHRLLERLGAGVFPLRRRLRPSR